MPILNPRGRVHFELCLPEKRALIAKTSNGSVANSSQPGQVASVKRNQNRIGILTSGGDCPGLNAVIRGVVKTSHQLGYDCVGFLKGYEGLYDPVQYKTLTPNNTRGRLMSWGLTG